MLNDFDYFTLQIIHSLNSYDYQKAIFISERLFAEIPNSQTIFLLATSYYRARYDKLAHTLLDNIHYKDYVLKASYNRLLYARIAFELGHFNQVESIILNSYSKVRGRVHLTQELINNLVLFYTSSEDANIYTNQSLFYTEPTQALNILCKVYIKTQEFENAKICLANSLKHDAYINVEAFNYFTLVRRSENNKKNDSLFDEKLIGKIPKNLDIYHDIILDIKTLDKNMINKAEDVNISNHTLVKPETGSLKHRNNILLAPQKAKPKICKDNSDVSSRVNILNCPKPLFIETQNIATNDNKLMLNYFTTETSGIKRRSTRIIHQNNAKTTIYNNHTVRLSANKKLKIISRNPVMENNKKNFNLHHSNLKNITNHQMRKTLNHKKLHNYTALSEDSKENVSNPNSLKKPLNMTTPEYVERISIAPSSIAKSTQTYTFVFPISSLLRTLSNVFQTIYEAIIQMQCYNCEKAVDLLKKLPSKHVDTMHVLSLLGQNYYELVNYSQACEYYRRVVKMCPAYLEGLQYYSSCLWHLKMEHELSALALDLSTNHYHSPITWCVVGNCFALQSQPENAVKALNRAIQLNPDMAFAYTILGHEYICLGNMEMATNSFQNALRIDKDHYTAWYGLGVVSFKMEKYKMAEYYYKKALDINPKRAILIFHMGAAQKELRRPKDALKSFNKAITLDPNNQLARFHKVDVMLNWYLYDECLEELEYLQVLQPKEPKIYHMIGKVHQQKRNFVEAIKYFQWALLLDPHNNEDKKFRDDLDELLSDARYSNGVVNLAVPKEPPVPTNRELDNAIQADPMQKTFLSMLVGSDLDSLKPIKIPPKCEDSKVENLADTPPAFITPQITKHVSPAKQCQNVPLLSQLLSQTTEDSVNTPLPTLNLDDLSFGSSHKKSDDNLVNVPYPQDSDQPGTSNNYYREEYSQFAPKMLSPMDYEIPKTPANFVSKNDVFLTPEIIVAEPAKNAMLEMEDLLREHLSRVLTF